MTVTPQVATQIFMALEGIKSAPAPERCRHRIGPSVASEYQHLYRHQKSLHAQDNGMQCTNGIYHMQE